MEHSCLSLWIKDAWHALTAALPDERAGEALPEDKNQNLRLIEHCIMRRQCRTGWRGLASGARKGDERGNTGKLFSLCKMWNSLA